MRRAGLFERQLLRLIAQDNDLPLVKGDDRRGFGPQQRRQKQEQQPKQKSAHQKPFW
jgi:hypothetical protein